MTQDSRIGKTISHYKITGRLGGGGMGVVYTAEDINLKRTVALKFLALNLITNEETKTRFVYEARAASALDHPRIGTIYEIQETENGEMFIAMAYYDGETLKDRINRGGISLDEALKFVNQIANGLGAAHEQGIVHRDVKPANIIITKEGFIKIVDFGLAKLGDSTRITQAGTSMGTPAYMSPEQAKGMEADQRSDIWSLGVIFYELLTGKLPFKGNDEMSMMFNIVNEPLIPLKEVDPQIPEQYQKIIDKALAKKTDDRYNSMTELIADIQKEPKKQIDDINTVIISQVNKTDAKATQILKKEAPSKPRKKSKRGIKGIVLAGILAALAIFIYPFMNKTETSKSRGFINLNSKPPGAKIFLNSKLWEKTSPTLIGPLEAGTYDVLMSLEGFSNKKASLTVNANDTTDYKVELAALSEPEEKIKDVAAQRQNKIADNRKEEEKAFTQIEKPKRNTPINLLASLFVQSVPIDAQIFIDGQPTGETTPHKFENIRPGKHQVRVELAGFKSHETDVTVRSGKENEINLGLTEKGRGEVRVTAVVISNGRETFTPANFTINGESYQTPRKLKLPEGEYKIEAKLFGYDAQQQNVVISGGQTEIVKFIFKK